MSLAIRPPLQRSGARAGLRLPAEARALWAGLAIPWLTFAAGSLAAGLSWRLAVPTGLPAAPDLPALLDWAGFAVWLAGPLLLAALDRMQAVRRRTGVVPAPATSLLASLRLAPAILLAPGLLALGSAGVFCAYRGDAELLAFRDAELRLFSVPLAPAYLLPLLVGGGLLGLLSALLLELLRRQRRISPLALWTAATAGLAALLLQPPARTSGADHWLQVFPGAMFAGYLQAAASASTEYVYYVELAQGLLLSISAWLALGLVLAFGLVWLTMRSRRPAEPRLPGPLKMAGWAAALLPALLAFPRWWLNAGEPAGAGLPRMESLCAAAVVAGWTAYLLAAALQPPGGPRRAHLQDWARLAAPPLVWALCGLPLVESALRTRAEILAATGLALSIWLAGLAALRTTQSLTGSPAPWGGAAGGVMLALLALPLWQGDSLPALAAGAAMAAAADGRPWEPWIAAAALLAVSLLAVWLSERRPRPKVRRPRADTSG